jgi:hypothetical protein
MRLPKGIHTIVWAQLNPFFTCRELKRKAAAMGLLAEGEFQNASS